MHSFFHICPVAISYIRLFGGHIIFGKSRCEGLMTLFQLRLMLHHRWREFDLVLLPQESFVFDMSLSDQKCSFYQYNINRQYIGRYTRPIVPSRIQILSRCLASCGSIIFFLHLDNELFALLQFFMFDIQKSNGKFFLFKLGSRRKPESLFPAEPTAGVFTSPAPILS